MKYVINNEHLQMKDTTYSVAWYKRLCGLQSQGKLYHVILTGLDYIHWYCIYPHNF